MYIVHTFLDLAFLIQQYFMEIPPSYIFSLASVIYYKKSYDQPRQHIKKQRHYFATKVCLVKAMVFPVVMYGCESWTIKTAEC